MSEDPACCAASRESPGPGRREEAGEGRRGSEPSEEFRTDPAGPDDDRTNAMVRVEGGTFRMGTDDDVGYPEDGEGPARDVTLDPFFVDRYAVTNAQFLAFVRDTGYTTDAERFGWSFVFRDFVSDEDREHVQGAADGSPWWLAVEGANWFRPFGPGANVDDLDLLRHPVTHVSWRDARAYADWADKRLPTEAEWERAARGGRTGSRFPWGDELVPDGDHRCNVWQGDFPQEDTAADGYHGTAPVDAFEPNGVGIYNVCGNVWEWCADWFSPDYHTTNAYEPDNPRGPPEGEARVMRGGSYLCHESWCNRYRLAARSKNTPVSTTGNLGFRCVVDVA